jgi:glutamate---cysteine ligase / carboxylate-amine ligase
MAVNAPSFTVGVEEEYLLVDPSTRDLVAEPPPELWEAAEEALGTSVMPEMLRAQIEVATRPHETMQGVADELRHLRRSVGKLAADHGAALMAASTHPSALWWEQRRTEKDRYQLLAEDLAILGQRLVICGMHVHVAVEDPDLRIDLMNQVTYFLPHLLALSTSSPFWGGRNTGLKSYRTNVFRTLPRTGLPEHFDSWSEYQRHVDVLINAGSLDDASKLWWDVRPAVRFPTLEMRASDICTRWEDAVALASLYRCLLHMLFRLRSGNQRWRTYSNMLVSENIWRSQRYGIEGELIDIGKSELVPFTDLVEELIALTAPDADELGCVPEILHLRSIVAEGTSADRQVATYEAAIEEGAEPREALVAVVDRLLTDTVQGV